MIRKIVTGMVLLLLLSATGVPVMAAGGNGDGSGGSGNSGGDSAGNAGNGDGGPSGNAGDGGQATPGPEGPQAQPLQEEQKRQQQETVDQPGVQINQQDRDQDQGRTGVDTTAEPASTGAGPQGNRDLFLERLSLQEERITRAQDRQQARVDVALYAFSRAGDVAAGAGPEFNRLAGVINASRAATNQAEYQVQSRSSFSRMLFGGDQDAAGQLIRYADQNRQHIALMEQLVANCSACDPQVKNALMEQVQVLSQEQNRLTAIGRQEQADRGLFGWLLAGSGSTTGTGQAVALTGDERYWVTFMREEEKLARDVYLVLGAKWNLPVFPNIARSEQTHMDSVQTLLDRYGVDDPAEGREPGEFENPDLQALYDDLVARGSVSPEEALKVGVLIEEIDIDDLDTAIATTEKTDIVNVYTSLLRGSQYHLKAFRQNLARY